MRFYFVWARFGIEYMEWALFALLRNGFFAFIPVMIGHSNPTLQLCVFAIWAAGWAFAVLVNTPWRVDVLNQIDGVILLNLGIASGVSTIYVAEEYRDQGREVVAVILIMAMVIIIAIVTMIIMIMIMMIN